MTLILPRRSVAVLLVCLSLASVVFTHGQPRSLAQSVDETAMRVLVTQYFEAWQKEDLVSAMRLWSEKSLDLAAAKSGLQSFFADNDKIEFNNLQVKRLMIDGERGSALATVEGTAIDTKTGKPTTAFSKMNRAMSFVKEAGGWKVWRDAAAEADLASALVTAKTEEERAALLAKEKELLTAELWRALITLGEKPRTRGKYAEALHIYSLVQKVAELINDTAGLAQALKLTGVVTYRQGHYDSSLDYLQKSLKLSELLNEKIEIAETWSHIGIVHYLKSDYKVAQEYYQRSLALYDSIGRGDRADVALTGMGIIHYRQANYDLALGFYRKALAAREKSGNRLAIGYALSNLGGLYQVLGNYNLALDYHLRALTAFEAEGAKPDAVTTLSNIGLLYNGQGNYGLALEYYQKAVPFAEAAGQELEVAVLLGHIGSVQRGQGQNARALENFQKSLSIVERLGNKLRVAADLLSIGNVYENQGDNVGALEYYQRSLGVSKAIDTKDRVAAALIAIGRVYNLQGNYTMALESAETAVNIARQIGRAGLLRLSLTVAGTAHKGLKHTDQARRAFEEAIAVAEDLRTQVVGGEQAQQLFFEVMVSPYHKMVELLAAQGKADEALVYSEQGKARVLLDVLRSGRVNVTKAMTAREREQERSLRAALVMLNTQISGEERRSKPDQARLAQLKAQLEKARLEHEDFQIRLYAARPDLKVQRGEARPFSSEHATELLTDSRTALLEYVVTGEATYLFVLTAGGDRAQKPVLKLYDLKVKSKELAGRVQTLRQRIANNDLDFAALSAELYELLIGPAKAQLQGKTRLVIVPDDVLWEMPFQALRPAGGKYLVQSAAISYSPSLTVLREMTRSNRNRATESTLLAMGNPQLAGQTVTRSKSVLMSARVGPLPDAERMVKSLARIYGMATSRIYVGAQATEAVLKAEAGKHRILHLATHGVLNDASPMYSHVVLSQGEGVDDDGLLEAWEIMDLDLRADLVVLSACETARGKIGAGEGVIGMSWALFVAGSPTSVVSQWKVESSSTTELMIEFHTNLKSGAGKAEAMRRSAMKLIADRRYGHPFYWAGFIVVGDGN